MPAIAVTPEILEAFKKKLHEQKPGVISYDAALSAAISEAFQVANPTIAFDVRGLAVEVVDRVRGYTFEFSSHPAAHVEDYNAVEGNIRAALRKGNDLTEKVVKLRQEHRETMSEEILRSWAIDLVEALKEVGL